jgi:kynurenine formamidase
LLDLPPAPPTKTERPAMPEWVGPGGYRHWIKTTLAICKCLVNANRITTRRVRMLIVPLRIKNGGASPTRFVAVEDEEA